jgi:hypothetical protein
MYLQTSNEKGTRYGKNKGRGTQRHKAMVSSTHI